MSSAEAELYAANYGAQQAMGLRSLATDFGISVKINLEVDASAAIGIMQRRGLGKLRHICANDLWMQEKVKNKEFNIIKIGTDDNTADVGTKALGYETIRRHLTRMGFTNSA